MPDRKYSDAELEEAIAMREDGMTYKAIGEELGMSHGAVYYHCLRLGADSPHAQPSLPYNGPMEMARGNHTMRRFTPEEDAKLVEMDLAGVTRSAIARQLGRKRNSFLGRLMTLARQDERLEAAG